MPSDLEQEIDKIIDRFGLDAVTRSIMDRSLRAYDIAHGTISEEYPLAKLHFSVRTYNALSRRGVKTIGQLIDCRNKGELSTFRNIGKVSRAEIERILSLCTLAVQPLKEQKD